MTVNGQWQIVNGQWQIVNGQWSIVNGQWSIVNGQWSTINFQLSTFKMQHIIKKQVINLFLPPALDSFRVQQKVSEYYQGTIVPQLQEIFDRLVTADETFEFGTIEIDLGTISYADIEAGKWSGEFISRLTDYLTKIIGTAGAKKTMVKEKTSMSSYRQWLFYMQNGHLPWNALQTGESWYASVLETLATDIKSIEEFRKVAVSDNNTLSRVIMQHGEPFLASLVETLTAENQKDLPNALAELYRIFLFVYGLPAYTLKFDRFHINEKKQFIRRLWKLALLFAAKAGKHIDTPKLAGKIFSSFPIDGQIINLVQKEFADEVFIISPELQQLNEKYSASEKAVDSIEALRSQNKKQSKEKAADELNKRVDIAKKNDTDEKKTRSKGTEDEPAIHENESRETIPASDQSELNKSLPEDKAVDNVTAPTKAGIQDPDIKEIKKSDILSTGNKENKTSKDAIKEEINLPDVLEERIDLLASQQINGDGIFVQHAGLVLLHPFLHSFFKRLQLVADGKFIDLASHHKALHLLHFLASGEKHPEEHMLVVAKVLCAHAIHHPVDKEIEITDAEIDEANNLLSAAIEQWEILKNTSPDGLREGFLQRSGKLYRKHDDLYLQVESSSIDILLDQLPWNLGIVKLPWMKEILRVDWR